MKRVGLPAPVGNWITVEEAAKKLGMSTAGVRQLVRRKTLSRFKFGNLSAFRDVDIDKLAKKPAATGRPRKGFARG
jgi:excisionase family DNA binding protein